MSIPESCRAVVFDPDEGSLDVRDLPMRPLRGGEVLVRVRLNFRKLRNGDLVIIYVDGNRFRILSGQDLDKQSQRLLDEHA